MMDDYQLLERFATCGDEDAFRELIERHLDLVYSATLRRVNGDATLAQDVAQTVFTDLARKARLLSRDVLLTGWLYEAARFAAAKAIRSEHRRQAREQEALTMQHLGSEPAPGWEQLGPVLDDAMGDLSAHDRNAILLRYFKNQDFRTVGLALGVSDGAAQRRVSRAVKRLREILSKRGVDVGTSGLVVVISANAVQAAPAGLAAALSTATAAFAGTTLTTAATATAINAIAMTTLQKTLIGTMLIAAVGVGILETRHAVRLRDQVQSLHQTQMALAGQVDYLNAENERLSNLVAQARQSPAELPKAQFSELLKLRGMAQLNSREIAELKAALAQGTKIPDFLVQSMNEFLDTAADQERRSQTNGAMGRIRKMSAKLGLRPEQQQFVRDQFIANSEPRVALAVSRLTGEFSLEEIKSRLDKIQADEDGALTGVLTHEQMTAYQQLRTDEQNASARSWAAYERSIMKRELKLSDEQANQMSSILASLQRGFGGPGMTEYSNAREQLEIRLRAFEKVFTPEQLQAYRRIKLEDIEQHEQLPKIIKALKQ